MKMGDSEIEKVEAISSGSLTLDGALVLEGIQKEGLSKYMGQNLQVKLL